MVYTTGFDACTHATFIGGLCDRRRYSSPWCPAPKMAHPLASGATHQTLTYTGTVPPSCSSNYLPFPFRCVHVVAGEAARASPSSFLFMEVTEGGVDALSGAFGATAKEGVPALEKVAAQLASFDQASLQSLCNAEVPLSHVDMDARELMATLVSTTPSFGSPAQLALYVVILSRVYAALCADTVARKQRLTRVKAFSTSDKDAVPTADVFESSVSGIPSALTTMRAWSRDVVFVLVHSILPQLCLCDAQPQTLSTSQQLDAAVPPPPVVDVSKKSTTRGEKADDAEEGQLLLLRAIADYNVPDALTYLVDTVYRTTRDFTVCPLLLSVYATLSQMEAYVDHPVDNKTSATSSGSVLQVWQLRFFREVEGVPEEKQKSEMAAAAAAGPTSNVGNFSSLATAEVKLRSLLGEVVQALRPHSTTDVWSFAVVSLGGSTFPRVCDSSMFSTDLERGVAPPQTTAALLARERDEEVDACRLIATDSLDDPSGGEGDAAACSPFTGDFFSSLCRQGALLLIADALRDTTARPAALYSVSATSLLLCVANSLPEALKCTSCSALMRHLLLLHDIVAVIPKYSIECAAEEHTRGADASAPMPAAHAFDRCLSKRYEALFEIEKGLISISALCPFDEHRRAARAVALRLLERLKEAPRVRLHLSLVTLCPYPSIARFFLERLLEDWREQQAEQSETSKGGHAKDSAAADVPFIAPLQSSLVSHMVPMGLGGCMTTFLQHLTSGTRGFLDPLVVSLNFVRVSASRQAWIREAGQSVDRLSQRKECVESSERRGWTHLLGVVKHDVLPQCEALVNSPAPSLPSPFSVLSLSPLDAFSLSCAVDGVKAALSW
ncbi:hypothetical protein ABL78_1618 [Leptomonas seymouri]|uniref:Uncharacterized protein n=1 Tax=Leptomonas seymouri TaxID=5684 RepID=A0A0N1IAE2_LEPSE|nr:hypothetical protein ABL78_1618 [Leptomonas seymouri]|eukprot:KPI89285.1 hypothetical protein ABL78_1618 [Leptomonas seymouri]